MWMDGTDMHAAMCSVGTRLWDSSPLIAAPRMSRHVCSAWCAAVLWTIRPSSASPRRDRELVVRFVALIFDNAVMRGVRVWSFAVKIYFGEFCMCSIIFLFDFWFRAPFTAAAH